jgi:phenylacetate-CoA ligase
LPGETSLAAAPDQTAFERVLEQLEYVRRHSPFYQRKFAEAGATLPVKIRSEFETLPFTEKDELRQSQTRAPALGDFLCVEPDRLVRIGSTSGTSGTPLYYGQTPNDMATILGSWKAVYDATGLTTSDRVLYALTLGGPYGAAYGSDALEWAGITNIPAGSRESYERMAALLTDLRPTALVALTNYPLRLSARLREMGIDPTKSAVRRILVGGEAVEAYRTETEAAWDAEVFDVMGSGEFGMLWAECEQHGGMHHVALEAVFIEYLEPGTERVVSAPKAGSTYEIVYTALGREGVPLIRYRSHDLVEITHVSCLCGRQTPRVIVVGRSDDMLKVRGANVFPSAVLALLAQFGPPIVPQFRIVLPDGQRKFSSPLCVIAECAADAHSDGAVSERLAAYLRAHLNVRTEITLVASGALASASRDALGRDEYFIHSDQV